MKPFHEPALPSKFCFLPNPTGVFAWVTTWAAADKAAAWPYRITVDSMKLCEGGGSAPAATLWADFSRFDFCKEARMFRCQNDFVCHAILRGGIVFPGPIYQTE